MGKPAFVEALESSDPELLKHMQSLQEFALAERALSPKIKVLMSMLCDAILGHGDGVNVLAERARAQGATEDEIAETVRMAFFFGGIPALVTGTRAFGKD